MRKGSSIIGLKVIGQDVSEKDKAHLGIVKDLVFDHETDEVLGLVLAEKDLFGLIDAQIVPWSEILTIGTDAVIVRSLSSRVPAHDDSRTREVMDRATVLSGTKLFTTDGRALGTFADLFVDETTGRVVGYEVSGGFVSDTMSGKRFIPAPQEIKISKDVALVPPAVADELAAQRQQVPGGLQGGVQSATAALSDRVGGAYDAARVNVGGAYENMMGASVERQKAFVIGKIAAHDVVIPPHRLAAAPPAGDVVGHVAGDVTGDAAEAAAVGVVAPVVGAEDDDVTTTPIAAPVASTDEIHEVTAATPSASAVVPEGVAPVESVSPPIAVSSFGTPVEGEVLVRCGDVITAAHADRAVATGVMGQLILAAGGSVANQAVTATQQSLNEAVTSGTATAQTMGATVQQKAEAAAIGRPAGRDVLAPDGSILITTGTVVTPEILETARLYNKEREVIAAAGLGAAAQGLEQVKESAGQLWETLKQKAAEVSGSTQDRTAELAAQAEEAQIRDALGRPVTRVILDHMDCVILKAGDVITNAAVAQARDAGVLDILLKSYTVESPPATPVVLRSSEPGQAAIPTEAAETPGQE